MLRLAGVGVHRLYRCSATCRSRCTSLAPLLCELPGVGVHRLHPYSANFQESVYVACPLLCELPGVGVRRLSPTLRTAGRAVRRLPLCSASSRLTGSELVPVKPSSAECRYKACPPTLQAREVAVRGLPLLLCKLAK
jgi:hypothetical protein